MKKIIVFDGPSACGKTTLLERVYSEMNKKGVKVDYITERNQIRNLIDKLQMKDDIISSELPPVTESLFWTMSQSYKIETELPEKQGDIVLVDRYIYTPITYQYLVLKEQGATLDQVSDYISKPFGIPFPTPDLSLILIAPLDTLKKRFKEREKREMNPNEIKMTEQALEIYKKLGERFENYHLLDSDRPIDEVYMEAEQIIKNKGIL